MNTDTFISLPQYSLPQAEKERLLVSGLERAAQSRT